MRNKMLFVIGFLLFILGQLGVNYLIYKYKNNVEIPKVQLRDIEENKKVNKNTFAVMLEQTDGTYTQSNSSVWPGVGYLYNGELSGCIDNQGNAVENAISFNDSTKTATLRTNGTIYCYLYFKGVAPTSGSISINNNATYTTSTGVTLTLSAIDASEMCISNTTSCSSWESYSTSKSWTLASGDGTKTVYVTYRNASGKTVGPVTDTIILDTTAPSLTVSAPTGTSTSSPTVVTSASYTVKGTASDSTSGIKSVTVNGSAATISGSNWNKAITLTNGTTTKVTVVATDKAGKTTTITRYVKLEVTDGNALIKKASLNNEGGLYRYQGTNPNNYICFGTTNKSTCTGNTDAYMYRIIGVNSSGQMKLIKKEALNKSYEWYSSKISFITWNSSSLYSGLNGSYFLSNTTYVPNSTWSNKIATTNWKYGDLGDVNVSASSLYSTENSWTSTIGAKIGLMYAHDYIYGLSKGNNCWSSGTICKTSWLHLSNNDSSAPNPSYEWTLSRYGLNNSAGYYSAWCIYSSGGFANGAINSVYSVRPVFFLNNSEIIRTGTGTLEDPYILS